MTARRYGSSRCPVWMRAGDTSRLSSARRPASTSSATRPQARSLSDWATFHPLELSRYGPPEFHPAVACKRFAFVWILEVGRRIRWACDKIYSGAPSMKVSRSTLLISCAWVFFVGGYGAVTLLTSRDSNLAAFGYFFACMVPLFANSCLLWN